MRSVFDISADVIVWCEVLVLMLVCVGSGVVRCDAVFWICGIGGWYSGSVAEESIELDLKN